MHFVKGPCSLHLHVVAEWNACRAVCLQVSSSIILDGFRSNLALCNKLSVSPCAMKTYGGVETSLHVFLISALHEWEQSVSCACGFDFRETIFGAQFINSWVDPTAGLDTVGNSKPSVPTCNRTLIPRSSSQTDQANLKQKLDYGVLGFVALPALSCPEIHKRTQRFGLGLFPCSVESEYVLSRVT
jgi:hypothetical protein